MTFTEIFEAIAEATGIEYSHFSVLGRIWDLADYYGVDRRGKLVTQVLRELPQLVNRSPESNLIHDLLQMTVRYSKYLCLTGAYSQETTTGKNLFDISKVTTKEYSNGAGIVNNGDGTLTVTNSAGNSGVMSEQKLSDVCPSLQIGETYVLSGISSGDNNDKIYLNGAKIVWLFEGLKVITQEMLDSYVTFYADSGGNTDTVSNLQIEKGNIATAYEPYTGGAPSPSPDYPQEMQAVEISNLYSVGKNLFNKDDIDEENNHYTTNGTPTDTGVTVTGNWYVAYKVNVPRNTNLYLSYEKSGKGLKQCSIYKVGSLNAASFIINIVDSGMFNTGDNDAVMVLFYSGKGSLLGASTYSNIMLNMGTTADPYTPYTGADTVTLSEPLILRALPNGVCDTYENGVITRRVGEITFDGSSDENWGMDIIPDTQVKRFYTQLPNGLKSTTQGRKYCLSNKLLCNENTINTDDVYTCFHYSTPSISSLYCIVDQEIDNVEDFKTWLQSNPIKAWYQLATPTTEALDIDLEWYGMENFWTDSELDPNMTWKGVSTGVD